PFATPRTHRPTLFPYTTLFRSRKRVELAGQLRDRGVPADLFEFAGAACAGSLQGMRHAIGMKGHLNRRLAARAETALTDRMAGLDRKSTRLNSSHGSISYAVFC